MGHRGPGAGAGLLLLLLCSHSSEMVVSISKVELFLLDTDTLNFDLYVLLELFVN